MCILRHKYDKISFFYMCKKVFLLFIFKKDNIIFFIIKGRWFIIFNISKAHLLFTQNNKLYIRIFFVSFKFAFFFRLCVIILNRYKYIIPVNFIFSAGEIFQVRILKVLKSLFKTFTQTIVRTGIINFINNHIFSP